MVAREGWMTDPLAVRPHLDTVFRGSRDKQPRAFVGGRRVPVLGENGTVVDICRTPDQLARYLIAPNAEVTTGPDGSIRRIQLLAAGDERGHLGENHGRSTVTTKRVQNDWGGLVGSDMNLEHKKSCESWGLPDHVLRSRREDR